MIPETSLLSPVPSLFAVWIRSVRASNPMFVFPVVLLVSKYQSLFFCYTSPTVVTILKQVLDVCNYIEVVRIISSLTSRFDCHMSYLTMQTGPAAAYLNPSACLRNETEPPKMHYTKHKMTNGWLLWTIIIYLLILVVIGQVDNIIKLKSHSILSYWTLQTVWSFVLLQSVKIDCANFEVKMSLPVWVFNH